MFDRERFLSREYSAKKTYLVQILTILRDADGNERSQNQIERVLGLLELPIISEETLIALFTDFCTLMQNIVSTQQELVRSSLSHVQQLLIRDQIKSEQEADILLASLS